MACDRAVREVLHGGGKVVEAAPDPRVREIGEEHAEAFARCNVEGSGLPAPFAPWIVATVGLKGWRHYAAFDGDQPVGFGALYTNGPLAWFGYASTRPSHRGLGIQGAIVAARLRDAARLGCEIAVVETADDTPEKPNSSTHNQLRMGFRVAYKRPNWVKKLVEQSSSPAT